MVKVFHRMTACPPYMDVSWSLWNVEKCPMFPSGEHNGTEKTHSYTQMLISWSVSFIMNEVLVLQNGKECFAITRLEKLI